MGVVYWPIPSTSSSCIGKMACLNRVVLSLVPKLQPHRILAFAFDSLAQRQEMWFR